MKYIPDKELNSTYGGTDHTVTSAASTSRFFESLRSAMPKLPDVAGYAAAKTRELSLASEAAGIWIDENLIDRLNLPQASRKALGDFTGAIMGLVTLHEGPLFRVPTVSDQDFEALNKAVSKYIYEAKIIFSGDKGTYSVERDFVKVLANEINNTIFHY